MIPDSSNSGSQSDSTPRPVDPHLMAALRRIIGPQRVISIDSLDAHGRAFLYQYGDRLPLRHASRSVHSRPLDLTPHLIDGDREVDRREFRDHLLEIIPPDEYQARHAAKTNPAPAQESPEASVYHQPDLQGSWWILRRGSHAAAGRVAGRG